MSKDDYHSITPWNSQERFFFTRPTAHKRRRPRPPRDKFFVGDQDRCLTGSCEFFLFCWLAGGVVEGGCGGFLQSCCNRPNQVGHKTIVTQVGPKLGQLTVIWTLYLVTSVFLFSKSSQKFRKKMLHAKLFWDKNWHLPSVVFQ